MAISKSEKTYCKYIITRGPMKGKKCKKPCKDGYCFKHKESNMKYMKNLYSNKKEQKCIEKEQEEQNNYKELLKEIYDLPLDKIDKKIIIDNNRLAVLFNNIQLINHKIKGIEFYLNGHVSPDEFNFIDNNGKIWTCTRMITADNVIKKNYTKFNPLKKMIKADIKKLLTKKINKRNKLISEYKLLKKYIGGMKSYYEKRLSKEFPEQYKIMKENEIKVIKRKKEIEEQKKIEQEKEKEEHKKEEQQKLIEIQKELDKKITNDTIEAIKNKLNDTKKEKEMYNSSINRLIAAGYDQSINHIKQLFENKNKCNQLIEKLKKELQEEIDNEKERIDNAIIVTDEEIYEFEL